MSVFSSQDPGHPSATFFSETRYLKKCINKLNGSYYLGKFQNVNERTEQPVFQAPPIYIRTEFPWGESSCEMLVQHFRLLTLSQNFLQPSENRLLAGHSDT